MNSVFLLIVVVMFLLAITDLIVGVSNDAVNFLNSAIGAKAATFRKIMIIASIGIMFGSVFSSGMMEVARKGVFNPQFFTIEQIMFLFAAVMLTDIILLDFYNTISLPTSTTVSIVFELLGSALAISFFAVLHNGQPMKEWGSYINGNRAVIIIVGIFLSVIVAFILGWLIQYITRLIVSYDYKKTMRSFGSLFGSASVALIVVFVVLKGLKGIPFIPDESLDTLKSNAGIISLVSFGLAFVFFQVFISRKGFSVYRFVTLLGTFALAMAFASNDLVNFVGVPIASFDSYLAWRGSGTAPESYMMESLAQPVQTNPLFLFLAGIIMTITLWKSKKARSVVKTSVNLGRQDEGEERFQANEISRGLVRGSVAMARVVKSLLPPKTTEWIKDRFIEKAKAKYIDPKDRHAFDMVRASVNLIVAAGIILIGTSLKLPLSTTFVTFMVLMGTSLADKAWAEGSAVYRISGVLTVIGGWFLTAIIALTVSIIFATLLINFKIYAFLGLLGLATLLMLRNIRSFRRNNNKAEVNLELEDKWFQTNFPEIEPEVRVKIASILERFGDDFSKVTDALIKKSRKKLSRFAMQLKDVEKTNKIYRVRLTQQIKNVDDAYLESGKILMLVYDLEDDLLYSLSNVIRACERHVSNLHPDLRDKQIDTLVRTKDGIWEFITEVLKYLRQDEIADEDFKEFKKVRKTLIKSIEEEISAQISLATSHKISGKNSDLILTILFSSKNIVTHSSRLVKLFYKLRSEEDPGYLLDKIIDE